MKLLRRLKDEFRGIGETVVRADDIIIVVDRYERGRLCLSSSGEMFVYYTGEPAAADPEILYPRLWMKLT